ncbi:uncharacterized protein RHOBADRAFT_50363 [Rhodotorula graminis WP1]|uniref:Proteophosphoglycan ppg4 n=1 Tax=Rhodotorula graminis (strain WP1) TaxID=578459 RepID=A0A0N8PZB8_RHOGW|nr:uncharacterized protein RHOBADRAFT_50363 [Rhodotorula graminis WP1]KPV71885.1 hypothetical protein RHOBADRAFT_50363 [Rhodotorula graminis WP1]
MDLPSPPQGANPYEFYRDILHRLTVLTPSDAAGFRARLVVLYALCAFLLVACIANFVVHALGYHVKRRRVWLFKLVKRDSGSTLGGLSLFVVLFGAVHTLYRSTVSPGDGAGEEHLAKWSFALWPVAYAVAWLLSFATFQSYLQVEGGATRVFGRSWMAMPAWLENLLFIGGGLATVATHTTLAIIGSKASAEQWRQYRELNTVLDREAAAWEGGPMPAQTAVMLLALMRKYSRAASDFYRTSANLSIGAAVLPVLLVAVNLTMVAFVWRIRRHIKFQISQLPSLQGLSRGARSSVAGQAPQARVMSVVPAPTGVDEMVPVDDVKEELDLDFSVRRASQSPQGSPSPTTRFIALPSLTPPTTRAFSICSRPVLTHDPLTGAKFPVPRVLPTRAQVLELADDVEAAKLGVPEQQVASRVAALIKAERELLIIGLAVTTIAIALGVTSAWSVFVLRRFARSSWTERELVLTLPLWICLVGISIGEALHAYVECRHVVVPWWRGQLYDARERRLSAATTSGDGHAADGAPYRERTLSQDVGGMRHASLSQLQTQSQSRALEDGKARARARTLHLGLGPLARFSPSSSALSGGGSGSSTPRRASHVEFDGAIAVAVEVTETEEVGDELVDPLERDQAASHAPPVSRTGASLFPGGTVSWSEPSGSLAAGEARRKEIWEL